MKTVSELYEKIIDEGIATERELELITYINGYNIETLNDVIFARTGYHDWEQYEESEG